MCVFLSFPLRAEEQTLEQAWALAYQNNPSLESKRAELRALDEQVSQALSHWRPDAEITSSVGKINQNTRSPSLFANSHYDSSSHVYGVQVTQPLFRGFRTVAETESAKKQVLAGRARLVQAEQQLFLDTATAFLGALRASTIVTLDRGYETVLDKRLIETRVREHAGELTQTDVRQAESRLARAHISRYQAETDLRQAEAAYARLVGASATKLAAPSLRLADYSTLDVLLQQAETHNPDIAAAQYAVEQADADIEFNRGSLLPEVNLVGSSTRNSGQSMSLPNVQETNQVMVQVNVPLYRSGADYSKTRAAKQVYTQRQMDKAETLNRVREMATNAWQLADSSNHALEADKVEVDAATKALEGVREESHVGTRTTLDVLNAEQELLEARISEARSRYDRDTALLQIRAVAGDLTAEKLHLAVGIYDPERHYNDVKYKLAGFGEDDAHYTTSSVVKEAH